jgi:hypothetical protein
VDLAEEFEENIQAKDASKDTEESEDDRKNSDLDAELGGDDDTAASTWDPTDYGRPPEVSSLIRIGALHCCVPTQVKAQDGSKVSCVRGKLQITCQSHADKIVQGAYRGNIGYYVARATLQEGSNTMESSPSFIPLRNMTNSGRQKTRKGRLFWPTNTMMCWKATKKGQNWPRKLA